MDPGPPQRESNRIGQRANYAGHVDGVCEAEKVKQATALSEVLIRERVERISGPGAAHQKPAEWAGEGDDSGCLCVYEADCEDN
jgi:hypothetical protein